MTSPAAGIDGSPLRPLDERRKARAPAAMSARYRLSPIALIFYALLLALVLGFGSAWWTLSGEIPIGGIRIGPWITWPRIGSRDADPYARAVVARTADIPLGLGEGLAFVALTDQDGRPLDSACTYRVGGTTPTARSWTLTLYGPQGRPVATDLGRSGFTASEVVRGDDGHFTVALSRTAVPGNWLQLPAGGSFTMMLRLYDTPVAAGSASLDAAALPAIVRGECAS